jgi:hypothetical protein
MGAFAAGPKEHVVNPTDKPFWRLVIDQWIYIVTSSGGAALLGVFSLFGVPIPSWVALALAWFGISLAIWIAGQLAHGERKKLAKQLEPKLEMLDESETDQLRRCRVRIKSLTDTHLHFGVTLLAMEPQPKAPHFQLPIKLQIAGEEIGTPTADLPGRQTRMAEVFWLQTNVDELRSELLIHGSVWAMPIELQWYTITLAAHADQGQSVEKTYQLVFADNSISLKAISAPSKPSDLVRECLPTWVLRNFPSLPNRLWQAWRGFWTLPPCGGV